MSYIMRITGTTSSVYCRRNEELCRILDISSNTAHKVAVLRLRGHFGGSPFSYDRLKDQPEQGQGPDGVLRESREFSQYFPDQSTFRFTAKWTRDGESFPCLGRHCFPIA